MLRASRRQFAIGASSSSLLRMRMTPNRMNSAATASAAGTAAPLAGTATTNATSSSGSSGMSANAATTSANVAAGPTPTPSAAAAPQQQQQQQPNNNSSSNKAKRSSSEDIAKAAFAPYLSSAASAAGAAGAHHQYYGGGGQYSYYPQQQQQQQQYYYPQQQQYYYPQQQQQQQQQAPPAVAPAVAAFMGLSSNSSTGNSNSNGGGYGGYPYNNGGFGGTSSSAVPPPPSFGGGHGSGSAIVSGAPSPVSALFMPLPPQNKGLYVVPEGQAWVVERRGKYHRTIRTSGTHMVVPYLDTVRFVVNTSPMAMPLTMPPTVTTRDGAVYTLTGTLHLSLEGSAGFKKGPLHSSGAATASSLAPTAATGAAPEASPASASDVAAVPPSTPLSAGMSLFNACVTAASGLTARMKRAAAEIQQEVEKEKAREAARKRGEAVKDDKEEVAAEAKQPAQQPITPTVAAAAADATATDAPTSAAAPLPSSRTSPLSLKPLCYSAVPDPLRYVNDLVARVIVSMVMDMTEEELAYELENRWVHVADVAAAMAGMPAPTAAAAPTTAAASPATAGTASNANTNANARDGMLFTSLLGLRAATMVNEAMGGGSNLLKVTECDLTGVARMGSAEFKAYSEAMAQYATMYYGGDGNGNGTGSAAAAEGANTAAANQQQQQPISSSATNSASSPYSYVNTPYGQWERQQLLDRVALQSEAQLLWAKGIAESIGVIAKAIDANGEGGVKAAEFLGRVSGGGSGNGPQQQ